MRAAPALIAVIATAGCGGSPPPPPPAPPRVVAEEQPGAPTVPPTDDDDDSGDGVAVTAARGHVEPSAVAAGLAPLQDQLTACYTERVGRRRWLGGHVSLHWDVRATGEVAAVAIAESDLGAWPVEHCLLEIARGADFGKPVGGDADFAVPLEFSAKGKLVIWDDDKALRAVGGQLAGLDSCAVPPTPPTPSKAVSPPRHPRRAHPRKPPPPPADAVMPDNVTVTLYVGANGHAQSVGFAAPAALPDEWSACAERVALAWRLPDPRSAVAKLAIRYRAR